MLPSLGGFEWIIILFIIILLFGVGRIGRLGGELGTAIRQFRENLSGEKSRKDEKKAAEPERKDDASG
jgi:sec-independent protein translocase protein TatA